MITNEDNGKQITLPIAGGTATGHLVLKTVWTAVTVLHDVNFGYLDVQLISAEFATAINAYAVICVQNGSDTTAVSFPVKNRSVCGCQTMTIRNTTQPVWQQLCTSYKTNKWLSTTRINFEIWNQESTTATSIVGGAAINITQMIINSDNNKELQLTLAYGSETVGKILVKIPV